MQKHVASNKMQHWRHELIFSGDVLETMTVHFSEAHDPTVIVRSAKINEWKLAYKDRNREILLDLVASCYYYYYH